MTPRLLGSRRRYYTTAEAARLLGSTRERETRRCERGYYRTRDHKPGAQWEVFAADIERELRKAKGGAK